MVELRLQAIKRRWKDERKLTTKDVDWLIAEADKAETMRAADKLRQQGRPASGLGDLFNNLLRDR